MEIENQVKKMEGEWQKGESGIGLEFQDVFFLENEMEIL